MLRLAKRFHSQAIGARATRHHVVVDWKDGRRSQFHKQYLYDHCRCVECFHPKTRQRLKMVSKDPGVKQVTVARNAVRIEWSNGHESSFPERVLHRASYDPPLAPQDVPAREWRLDPPSVDYEAVMCDESAVLDWLDKVHRHGVCLVHGVPATPQDTETLIRRIAHIRETHYGGFWDFTADMAHGDLAYSNLALPAHTDTTYFTDPAGLQIFHLLSHEGSGGESLLVDGFDAARALTKASYDTLARLAVPAHASGSRGQMLRPAEGPVLRHDSMGRLIQVRWNNEDRGVLGQGWTSEDVEEWYQAALEYEGLLRQAEFWVQLRPGTVVVIDNWRVLHGRAAFTGVRRMCGAYIGRDDWVSRRYALSSDSDDVWEYGW